MIDLQAVRDAHKCHEISKVGFIRGPNNPADGMTEPSKCMLLLNLLRSDKADLKVDQSFIRNSSFNNESMIESCTPGTNHNFSASYGNNQLHQIDSQNNYCMNNVCTTHYCTSADQFDMLFASSVPKNAYSQL